MVWSAVASLVTVILDLLTARRQPACAKDLEIAVLRHQLRVLQRRQPRPRLTRWEQLTLALLATKLRRLTAGARRHWARNLILVTPETVLVVGYAEESQDRGERAQRLVEAGFSRKLWENTTLGVAAGAGLNDDSPRFRLRAALKFSFSSGR